MKDRVIFAQKREIESLEKKNADQSSEIVTLNARIRKLESTFEQGEMKQSVLVFTSLSFHGSYFTTSNILVSNWLTYKVVCVLKLCRFQWL
jgi:hypothetical protein